MCGRITNYFKAPNIVTDYIHRLIHKIRADNTDLIDNILDKYTNSAEIKNKFIVSSHYSIPIYKEELDKLGLNICVDINMFSKHTSNPLVSDMQNVVNRISSQNTNNTNNIISANYTDTNTRSGNISSLISLITKKIDADTK
jgi:hypothetical protein